MSWALLEFFYSGPMKTIRPESEFKETIKKKKKKPERKAAIIIFKSCARLKKHLFYKWRNLGLENANELLKVKQLIKAELGRDPDRFPFPV